jgi:transcriptional regulator with XRE-family HTH domain
VVSGRQSTVVIIRAVNGQRIGRSLRALRHRLERRQVDVGRVAGVSQDLVSLAERGLIGRLQVDTLGALADAVGAELVVGLRWRGGDLDRLLDEGHAVLVGRTAESLEGAGWIVRPEVTFAIYADRGSIDLAGWHPPTSTLLVVEVKSELVSVEETLRRHDVKARLGSRIVEDRFGWSPRGVARLLVLPDDSTPRRRVRRHDGVLLRAYPLRGGAARVWLGAPVGASGSLLFLSLSPATRDRGRPRPVTRKRVRRSPGDAG